ncbi:FAD-dependent oxidoreductase [Actinoplanes sp. NPDC024001]|uniref:NAD(P)/FAD-dependent oxidoreductase n=1 Tax=Actinoplanes sp. NPDC024001 TaxID=3154598 RepID=UPI0033E6F2BD
MVVAGAGIVGACVAYESARAGLPVVLLDRGDRVPPATSRSFGWLGGTSGGDWPGASEDLRPFVLADHHRLAAEVPGIAHRWTGSLSWPSPATAAPGQHLIDRAAVASMEPHLRDVPDSALHIPTDGGLDPLTAVPALIRAAQALGGSGPWRSSS